MYIKGMQTSMRLMGNTLHLEHGSVRLLADNLVGTINSRLIYSSIDLDDHLRITVSA